MASKLYEKMERQFEELDEDGQEIIREMWEQTKDEGSLKTYPFFAIGYYKTPLGILPFCGVRRSSKSGISAKEIGKILSKRGR